jgi:hypothetical protein
VNKEKWQQVELFLRVTRFMGKFKTLREKNNLPATRMKQRFSSSEISRACNFNKGN